MTGNCRCDRPSRMDHDPECEYGQHIRRIVDAAPPLTDRQYAQIDRIVNQR